jgi:hypothetical protein
MRFSSISNEADFSRLRELAPTMGAAPVPGAAPAAAFSAPSAQAATGVAQATQDPQANAKMQAQQALDRANRKKEIQTQIAATQKQLQDLQKQLATIK